MANSGAVQTRGSANKSWVELCDEDYSSNSSADENADFNIKNSIKENSKEKCEVQVNACPIEIQKTLGEVTPIKKSSDVEVKEIKTEIDIAEIKKEADVNEMEIKTEKEESPWRFSYATVLKNSASKGNINVSPKPPSTQIEVKPEAAASAKNTTPVKSVKREIQREFLQEDLSLTSYLDEFYMQSPIKKEPEDEEMVSPTKTNETRAKKRFCPMKPTFSEDAVMPDELLMPSPKKVTRLSTRRKREPGESPLICKRSKHTGLHSTPHCVVPVESSPVELETDEQILLRRQKQIDYGKNTIGYERYCEMVPKLKRHRKHPQTPPKHIKYSRRAWDGLIKQWRQQLHFWDPPSEGGGNIDDLNMSSMSDMSSDTASQGSSVPVTPRDERRLRRYSRLTQSSASESSSVADDTGCSPLKDN